MFLSQVSLHPTEILPITHKHNLAPYIHFQLIELLEIIRGAVVRVYNVRLSIARWRHAAVRQYHSRIILVGIIIHMLAGRAMHFHIPRRAYIHTDLRRIIHPHLVFHDFGFESRLTKPARDIIGCGFVFG